MHWELEAFLEDCTALTRSLSLSTSCWKLGNFDSSILSPSVYKQWCSRYVTPSIRTRNHEALFFGELSSTDFSCRLLGSYMPRRWILLANKNPYARNWAFDASTMPWCPRLQWARVPGKASYILRPWTALGSVMDTYAIMVDVAVESDHVVSAHAEQKSHKKRAYSPVNSARLTDLMKSWNKYFNTWGIYLRTELVFSNLWLMNFKFFWTAWLYKTRRIWTHPADIIVVMCRAPFY